MFHFGLGIFRRYIIPYLISGGICIVLFGIGLPLLRGYNSKQVLIYLIGLLYSRGSPNWMVWSSPLWYLTCLFLCELIFFAIQKNMSKPIAGIILCAVIGVIYNFSLGVSLPWNMDLALVVLPFIYMGWFIRENDKDVGALRLWQVVIITFAFIALVFLNGEINYNLRNYGCVLISYLTGVLGTLIVWWICEKLKRCSLLEFVGRNSLMFLLCTYPIMNMVNMISKEFPLLENWIFNYCMQILICFCFVLVYLKLRNSVISYKGCK